MSLTKGTLYKFPKTGEISIRIERLEKREKQKFGDRILPDGDMYTTHMKFMEWVRAYDTGSVEMRSKAKHDE